MLDYFGWSRTFVLRLLHCKGLLPNANSLDSMINTRHLEKVNE